MPKQSKMMINAVTCNPFPLGHRGSIGSYGRNSKSLFKGNTHQMTAGSSGDSPPMLKSDRAKMKRDD